MSCLNKIYHSNVTKYTSAQVKWRVQQGWAGTGHVFVFAGWPWSLDMAGTSGSTQRAWWWVARMPLVRENSGNRFSRMWVGLKLLPVPVRNSSSPDSSRSLSVSVSVYGEAHLSSTRMAELYCSSVSVISTLLLLKQNDRELLKRGSEEM